MSFAAKVVILDEPTSTLGVKQAGVVLKYIAQARDRGLGVVFITQNRHHAYPVGDRFLLPARGTRLGEFGKSDIAIEERTRLMAGGARSWRRSPTRSHVPPPRPKLEVPATRPNSEEPMTDSLRDLVLDRDSPVPLYYQVAKHMEEVIESGDLPAGTMLENEAQIAERLGLSRPTIRQAMQYLSDKGLITRRRGVGTRVTQPKVRRPVELTSLYDDLERTGQEPSTKVLSVSEVPADASVARALGVAEGDKVLRLHRVRRAGKRPIAVMTNFLPVNTLELSEASLKHQGLYAQIRAVGIKVHAATQVVGARLASADEVALLREDEGAAVITMERIAYDETGTVIELGRHVYAASRYSLEMSLHIG